MLKTPLHSLHSQLNARFVPFAGYEMPVQYTSGIRKEHDQTRNSAGLFDISHMGQFKIQGENVSEKLESLVPGELEGLKLHHQRYSVFTNHTGGILDDLMITKLPDCYYLVVNAACKQKDYDYLHQNLGNECRIKELKNALIAIQGPKAAEILGAIQPDLATMSFLSAVETSLLGHGCLVHRCGYTGEDGYEISIENERAEAFVTQLLKDERITPAGLGARDSLRLEAGLCLYGHDLDETTTPVEADLKWIISKKYYNNSPVPARFPGADIILSQLHSGPDRIRRGFLPESKMPVREGAVIINNDGEKIGIITSGGFGQTIGRPISMGYIQSHADNSDEFSVEIRNKKITLKKVNLPFVRHRYYRNKP